MTTPTPEQAREAIEIIISGIIYAGSDDEDYESDMAAKRKLIAFIDHAEKLEAENATLREALKESPCPRPINAAPDDTSVEACVNAGDCGCGAAAVMRVCGYRPDETAGG